MGFGGGAATQDDDPNEKQISLGKSEIERRDFPIAKSRLMTLPRDAWDSLTGHQRFIVLANLGNIEAAKGLVTEATKLFFEAIVHDPDHIKAPETEGHAYLFSAIMTKPTHWRLPSESSTLILEGQYVAHLLCRTIG